jgi:hypothetical protein
MPWARPGERGYFYLVADPGYPAGTYTYLGTPGRVLLAGGVAHVSGDHHGDGPWDDNVAGRIPAGQRLRTVDGEVGTTAVERAIRAAADSARRGESRPVPQPRISEPND